MLAKLGGLERLIREIRRRRCCRSDKQTSPRDSWRSGRERESSAAARFPVVSSRCLVFPCRPPADVGQKRRFLERLGESALVLVPCSALTRSLLLELGKLFLLILPLVTAAVVALLLCEVGLQNNLGLANCFRIVPFVLPRALAYTISASWMFTVCAVYGSAAASNRCCRRWPTSCR